MYYSLKKLASVLIGLTLILGACGGGSSSSPSDDGGGTTVSGTPISGKVQAPANSIAQIDRESGIFYVTLDFFMSSARAAVTGLFPPVSNTIVELVRIDDEGIQVGAVLATTTTDSEGIYNLNLPDGVEPAADLVVQIIDSSGQTVLRAIVSGESVDIDPLSQFILDSLITEPGLILANINIATVRNLVTEANALNIDFSTGSVTTIEDAVVFLQATAELTQLVDAKVTTIASTSSIVGAWGSSTTDQPSMIVFYRNGFYMNYQTDSQDCPNGGVEYGVYSYDGAELAITPSTDENGFCGLSTNSTPGTYPVTLSNNGNQLNLTSFDTDLQANEPASFPRVWNGEPNAIIGGWDIGANADRPSGLVFYANGTYIHWEDTSSGSACTPGGVEVGTYSYDGSTITGEIVREENNDCGPGGLGTGSYTTATVTVSENVITFDDNSGDAAVLDRVETSRSSSGSSAEGTFDMTQFKAVSQIISSNCPQTPGGWTYSFSANSMTLTGSDTWNDGCFLGAQESFDISLPQPVDFDIPFNCVDYPICTLDDFNQQISGTDGDGRAFTSSYEFNTDSNTLTYVKQVEGTTFTETAVISPVN